VAGSETRPPADEPASPRETGGTLRSKLEASLARENAAREALEKAYGLSPGDLKDVDPSEYDARAAELGVTGRGLRQKYANLRRAHVDQIVAAHRYLEHADLNGIDDPAEITTRAAELEAERAAAAQLQLRNALADSGVPEDRLDDTLAQLIAGKPHTANTGDEQATPKPRLDTPASRTANLGALGRPAVNNSQRIDDDLIGRDRILAALERRSSQRRRVP
jgi:hypothetical protein